jgi:choline-sulfatase
MIPQNLLFIFSDQHDPQFLGVAGHQHIRTPNFDRLARSGTRFTRASTPSPICVPARASLATGRWVHDIHMWDNAFPYDGSVESWGHRLIRRGHKVAAIGKLHYRSDEDDNGFSEKIDTMNVVDGVGDRMGWLRKHRTERGAARQLAEMAGRGESTYTEYDRRVAKEACAWLKERGGERGNPPWLLFVGFVMPHLPLIAPAEFYDLYADLDLSPPRLYAAPERPDHPWIGELTKVLPYDKYFDAERRKKAITAYHGMVSLLDHHVGLLLDALDAAGLAQSTRVIYTSDHGEMLGNHGIWGKCCLYEESVSVPMIVSGQGVPMDAVATSEASLVDCYPSILDAFGIPETETEADTLPGRSLFELIGSPDPNRLGFSEYHAVGAMSGAFMVRRGRWKYMHYAGLPPQLFDLESDPHEANDLAADPAHKGAVEAMARELRMIVDPDRASADAFADQEAKIRAHGGVEAVRGVGV